MGLLEKLGFGKGPSDRGAVGVAQAEPHPHSEDPVDVALSEEMQDYTADELTRALGANMEGRVNMLVDAAKRRMDVLPTETYILLMFPNGNNAYAPFSLIEDRTKQLKDAGVVIKGNTVRGVSLDGLDQLAAEYMHYVEGIMPITEARPTSDFATQVRQLAIGYVKGRIMEALQPEPMRGYNILNRQALEQRLAGMNTQQPST